MKLKIFSTFLVFSLLIAFSFVVNASEKEVSNSTKLPYLSDKRVTKMHDDLQIALQKRLSQSQREYRSSDVDEEGYVSGPFDDLFDADLLKEVIAANLPPQFRDLKVMLEGNKLIIRVVYKKFIFKPLIRLEGELFWNEDLMTLKMRLKKANFMTVFSFNKRFLEGVKKLNLDMIKVRDRNIYVQL